MKLRNYFPTTKEVKFMAKNMLRFSTMAIALILAVGVYQPKASALGVDKECNWECGQAYHYCVNNPEGTWIGYWINRDCSANETWTFCDNWECPNSTQLYSVCMENPELPGCSLQEEDAIAEFCVETGTSSCQYDCEHDSRGTCVEAHVSDNGSAQCFCTYTLKP
jgi:hypothetical protein